MSNKINELVALLNTVPAGQLTENAVQTYLDILNIEIVEKGSSSSVSSVIYTNESPRAKVSRLLAEAKSDASSNKDKYHFTSDRVITACMDALSMISREEYQTAFAEVNYCRPLATYFDKYPELISTLSELIK